jgi:hypothetical protein
MFTKIKENIIKLTTHDLKNQINYPLYYKENGKIIKELENGEKWVVRLDSNYNEILEEYLK